MSRFRIHAVVVAFAVAGCATAPVFRTDIPAATTPSIEAGDLRSRLYIFADDSMLGRESGQLGNVRGTNYVAREMQRMGLQPGGENGTFFQTVPIDIARIDRTRRLAVDGAFFDTGIDVLPFYNSNGGVNVPQGATIRSVDGARVVFGGEIGSTNALPPAQAAGKVVVFTIPTAADGRREYRFYRTASLARYSDAAGIAVVSLDVMPRATLARLLDTQGFIRNDATGTAPLIMYVAPPAAARMLGVASLGAATVGQTGRRTLSGGLGFTEAPAAYPSRNVIGILPGRDAMLRGQYVAIGAHNDHIGLERRPLDHDSVLANNMMVRRQGVQDTVRMPTPAEAARILALRDSLTRAHGGVRRDSVNNGADDDGSGTVAMLEIAEQFASATERPRRSLLFVSHTGEEKGLWGSEWFTDHPTLPRDSIVAQLNMDMVGRGKATDIMGRGPNNLQLIGAARLSTQLGALIDSVNAARAEPMDIDRSFDTNGHPLNRYCRSDHYMYARYGIPIAYMSLGYHTDYHQVTDESQYIDYDHLARIAGFVHDVAEAVANRAQRLVVDKPRPDPKATCRQ